MPAFRKRQQPILLVSDHTQQRPPQVMGFELGDRGEALHESLQIAAILLELPPTVHLHERQELHAGGTD